MKIIDSRVKEQEQVRSWWCVTVEPQVTREDVLEPDFWAFVAVKFKRGERVEIMTDDSAWFGEYLIMDCDRTFAKLHELNHHNLKTGGKISPSLLFEAYWGGRHGKWGVRRTTDSVMIKNQFETEAAAQEFLAEYLTRIDNGNITA